MEQATETRTKPRLKFRSSWDDGDPLDMKLAALLSSYGLPAVFYIPTHNGLTSDEIKYLNAKGFEIGGHTVDHPQDMKLLTTSEIYYQINANRKYLEMLIGKPVTKFCYPRGRFDNRVVLALQQLGFRHARTTVVLQTEMPDKWREPTTIHVYDRKEYNGRSWVEVAKGFAKYAADTNGTFHIWGHSWEIERDDNWHKLELFFLHLKENYEIMKP